MTISTLPSSGAPRSRWREWHGYAPLDAPTGERASAAAGDLLEGLRRWRLWSYLAVEHVKNQYRRTTLGPWWVTLQTFAFVVGLAVLFGSIFRMQQEDFLPYVACGFIVFTLLTGLTRGAAQVFLDNAASISSNRQPLSALVLQTAAQEGLAFAHNLVILVGLGALGLLQLSLASLLTVAGVVLVAINGVAVGLWLGPTVARFRDVGPLVASLLQMLMFFTPIFWDKDDLTQGARTALLSWNPFAYLLDTCRGPLLGDVEAHAYVGAAVVTVVNVLLALVVFTHSRSRVPYWVS